MPLKYKFCLIFLFSLTLLFSQPKKYKIHTVAFYNFENLYDTVNDEFTNDDEWTPNGAQRWTTEKYQQKLKNLARVISEIGSPENSNAPVLLGCAEVENRDVLEDLIKEPKLQPLDLGIIHFDSPDKRGIDVALLYQKKYFRPTSFSNIPLIIYKKEFPKKEEQSEVLDDEIEVKKENKNRVFTRDQLLVSGFLEDEEIHIIVNHWPSRSGGEKATTMFRGAAGKLNRKIIDSLQQINPQAKVLTMGDFNDGPFNKSIKTGLGAKGIKAEVAEFGVFNPYEDLANKGLGTIAYRDSWNIFDQIIMTASLVKSNFSTFNFWKAGVFNRAYLIQNSGVYKGYPLRNTLSEAGFSDHLPVYIYLIKQF
jgi:hypothetical protein